MAFKLQLTDEMAQFLRSSDVSDEDAGKLIRLLLDRADGTHPKEPVPEPLRYVYPIFAGQVERFMAAYERKRAATAERVRRSRALKATDPPDDPPPCNALHALHGVTERYTALQSVTGVTERYKALHALQGVTDRDTALHDSVTHIPNQTIPDHTRTDQTIGSSDPIPTHAHARAREAASGRSGRIGEIPPPIISSYDDIYDPSHDAVAMAVAFCFEKKPHEASKAFKAQRRRVGEDAFREELARFYGEVNSGEEVNNRGAALMARLKRLPKFDPDEAAEARDAVAALAKTVAESS